VRRSGIGQSSDWYYTQSKAFVQRYIKSGNPINKRTARLQSSK